MSTKLDSDNDHSINELRNEALALIRTKSADITKLAEHVEALDAALLANAERSVDEMRSLVSAAGRLASLLREGRE